MEWYRKGDLDFGDVTTVNLDEYRGLPRENDQSYYYFMHNHLFDYVNINPERTFLPDGMNDDPEKECARYEEVICATGGVDLQLLGLGHNGHIGFNEPGEFLRKGRIAWICSPVPLRQTSVSSRLQMMFRSRLTVWEFRLS